MHLRKMEEMRNSWAKINGENKITITNINYPNLTTPIITTKVN